MTHYTHLVLTRMAKHLVLIMFIIGSNYVFAQYDSTQIIALVSKNLEGLGLTGDDLQEIRITDQYVSSDIGMTHVYLLQQYQGLDIHNAQLSIHIVNGKVVKTNSRMVPLATIEKSKKPNLSAFQSLQFAASDLGENLETLQSVGTRMKTMIEGVDYEFSNIPFAREAVRAELKWLPGDDGSLSLVWCVRIYEMDGSDYWYVFVDADKGNILKKENLVLHCSFDHLHTETGRENGTSYNYDANILSPPVGASYNIFPYPIESPSHGGRMVVNNPWELAGMGNDATTLGWHDDGSVEYGLTRGNNVHAYADHGNTGDTTGNAAYSPSFNFDFPYDPALPPQSIKDAAITNLFYWNNIIHDVTYQYGFDEEAGNFQVNNLGRGGSGGDHVLAEGQDGGGTSNANFLSSPDGIKPRMQMYLWSPVPTGSYIQFNSPIEFVSKDVYTVQSAFSTNNLLQNVGPVTADLVLINDVLEDTHQACLDNLISNGNQVAGKIAMIDRGDCTFVEKVKYVQDLGAVGVIMVNNVSGDPITMGGNDNSIVIPAIMISMSEGSLIKDALLQSMVNITFSDPGTTIPDGDFDNGIITHEYAHGISNRLTGGPGNVSCLNNAEQMGEGWSDFFALILTTDWVNANPVDRRGIGTYSIGATTQGTGIRTYPYSTDFSINPFTYGDVSGTSVHFIGSVWATMLWEMTWEIIKQTYADPDIYHGTGGNNVAMQLVMAGMKLQPCSPGFVDGRDAILLADQMHYDGQYQCAIWRAFARRGLGVSADQGDTDNSGDGVEAFDVPTAEVFVDHTAMGAGLGNSWTNAYTDLAPSVGSGGCWTIINVAEGKYYPTGGADPMMFFQIPDYTIVRGGYPSGGSAIELRNPTVYQTHLSGDIGIPDNASDNSFHVLRVLPGQYGVQIDGVTIGDARPDPAGTNGYAPLITEGEVELINTEVLKDE